MPLDAPGKRPATPSGKDGAGAGRLQGALAVALVLVLVGGIGYFALHEPVHARPGSAAGAAAGPQDAANAAVDGVVPAVTGVRRKSTGSGADHDPRDPNDLANYAVAGQPAPTMGEVIAGLHKAGIRTGLGAFNPPGTSPPLVGLAVPEDYPLPEGYVRHFQATDDGQAIEPILMYSPDYEFLDAAGDAVVRTGLSPARYFVPGERPRDTGA